MTSDKVSQHTGTAVEQHATCSLPSGIHDVPEHPVPVRHPDCSRASVLVTPHHPLTATTFLRSAITMSDTPYAYY
jgi:hypothetical protein